MTTHVFRPTALAPDELDNYLAKGWFRMGHALATSRFVVFDGKLRSALWTRVPIRKHQFGRSARRLLKRNNERYTWRFGELKTDAPRERLYQKYRAHARGERARTLPQFLHEGTARGVFDTREISVWDGARLVAFSWFDVGLNSVESLIGVYDPAYQKDSLGIYTMLLEIEQARSDGRKWYYPGYVLPGEPAMDYKLRLGHIEFLHPYDAQWVPWDQAATVELPHLRVHRALTAVGDGLLRAGFQAKIRLYRLFDAPAWHPGMRDCLNQPLLLDVTKTRDTGTWRFVAYDLERGQYVATTCARGTAISADGERERSMAVMIVVGQEVLGDDVAEVTRRVLTGS